MFFTKIKRLWAMMVGDDVDESDPREGVKGKLEAHNYWPSCEFIKSAGKYMFHIDEAAIAAVAVENGLHNDEEFLNMLSADIKSAKMETSIKNMKMVKIINHCQNESAKYED